MNTHSKTICMALFGLAALLSGCTSLRDVVMYDDSPASDAGDVRIEVPQVIMVKHVDGQALPLGKLNPYPHTRVLRLKPGKHTLEAYYEVIYERAEGKYEKFATRMNRIDADLAPGASYRLMYDDPWTDALSDDPSSDDANIRLQQIASGATEVSEPAATTEPVAAEPTPAPAPAPRPALDALKSAWKDASKEDRAAFQSWIITDGN